MITCLIWASVALCWDLVMGYAGIFNLGQIVLFAIGGFTSAMLATHLGVSPWFGLILGGFVALLFGLALSLLSTRLTGWYVALLTLALHLSFSPILTIARPLGTGGTLGLPGLPPFSLAGYSFGSAKLPWYLLALFIFLIITIVVNKLINSKFGIAFQALRDSIDFAQSLGVNERKYIIAVFCISSFMTGVVGAYYAHYSGIMSPRILGIDIFIMALLMLVIGGLGNFPGAAIGGFAVIILNEALRGADIYRLTFFGAIIVLLVSLMPKSHSGLPSGLISMINLWLDLIRKYLDRRLKKA